MEVISGDVKRSRIGPRLGRKREKCKECWPLKGFLRKFGDDLLAYTVSRSRVQYYLHLSSVYFIAVIKYMFVLYSSTEVVHCWLGKRIRQLFSALNKTFELSKRAVILHCHDC